MRGGTGREGPANSAGFKKPKVGNTFGARIYLSHRFQLRSSASFPRKTPVALRADAPALLTELTALPALRGPGGSRLPSPPPPAGSPHTLHTEGIRFAPPFPGTPAAQAGPAGRRRRHPRRARPRPGRRSARR